MPQIERDRGDDYVSLERSVAERFHTGELDVSDMVNGPLAA